MTFNAFVDEQIARLEAIPGFQMGDGGRKEPFVNWLSDQGATSVDRAKYIRSNAAEFLRDSDLCQRIKAVIDECVEFSKPPGLDDIKAVWYRLYPPVSSLSVARRAMAPGTESSSVAASRAQCGAKREVPGVWWEPGTEGRIDGIAEQKHGRYSAGAAARCNGCFDDYSQRPSDRACPVQRR